LSRHSQAAAAAAVSLALQAIVLPHSRFESILFDSIVAAVRFEQTAGFILRKQTYIFSDRERYINSDTI